MRHGSSNLPAGFGVVRVPVPLARHVLSKSSYPGRDGPSRARRISGCGETPCLFGLAPCGVYRAATVTSRAVGSYPAVSPLPQIACMGRSLAHAAQQSEAVYFLLHWPSSELALTVPDVIRHTALRSSDFPPPPDCLRNRRQRSSSRLHTLSVPVGLGYPPPPPVLFDLKSRYRGG